MFSQKINQDIFPEVKYYLRVRTPKIEAHPDYFGPLIYPDNVVGTIVAWARPGATQTDLDKLNFAIYNYKNYKALAEKYKIVIQASPFVQWMLIPILLGAKVESFH